MHVVLCLQPHTIDLQMTVLGRKAISHVSVKDVFWRQRNVMDITTVKIGLMKVNVSVHYTNDNCNPLLIHDQHLSQNNEDDQIRVNEIGAVCCTFRRRKMYTGFWLGN